MGAKAKKSLLIAACVGLFLWMIMPEGLANWFTFTVLACLSFAQAANLKTLTEKATKRHLLAAITRIFGCGLLAYVVLWWAFARGPEVTGMPETKLSEGWTTFWYFLETLFWMVVYAAIAALGVFVALEVGNDMNRRRAKIQPADWANVVYSGLLGLCYGGVALWNFCALIETTFTTLGGTW